MPGKDPPGAGLCIWIPGNQAKLTVTTGPSQPVSGAAKYNDDIAGLAQLVEQLICNQLVEGSIPLPGTTFVAR